MVLRWFRGEKGLFRGGSRSAKGCSNDKETENDERLDNV